MSVWLAAALVLSPIASSSAKGTGTVVLETGTVKGRVFLPDGVTPAAGLPVFLSAGGHLFSSVSDEGGYFTFDRG